MYGRVDQDAYKSGLATCLNYLPQIQGGVTRRTASEFVSEIHDSSKKGRLQDVNFSSGEVIVIELGDSILRMYDASVSAGVTPGPQGFLMPLSGGVSAVPTAITNNSPGVITKNSHGFSNGQRVVCGALHGMTQLNYREFIIAGVTVNTFTLQDTQTGTAIDTTNFGTWTSGGGGGFSQVMEIATSIPIAKVFDARFVTATTDNGTELIYLLHADYEPQVLYRLNNYATTNVWSSAHISDFLWELPYGPINTTATTMTPSAFAAGSGVTLTASGVTGINNDTGFQTTDIGRAVRMQQGAVWGWSVITARTSTTVVTVTNITTLTSTAAKTTWRLGLWGSATGRQATGGWPRCGCVYQGRLFLGGSNADPQRFDGSTPGPIPGTTLAGGFTNVNAKNFGYYNNFEPSLLADGTVPANEAVSFTLDSTDVNPLLWLKPDEKGLLAGTFRGEWFLETDGQPLDATSPPQCKQSTKYGSAFVDAIRVGRNTIFVQRSARKLRELNYSFYVSGFEATDLTVISEHITGPGITQLTHTQEPQSIIWGVRTDGVLVGMPYERDLQSLRVGASRHIMGGASDAAGTQALVESVCAVPSRDGSHDELWMIVNRWINGATHRYIERLTQPNDAQVALEYTKFGDCGVELNGYIPGVSNITPGIGYGVGISAITKATPGVITNVLHGLSNGDHVQFANIVGMTELNGPTYLVANKTGNTFQLTDLDGNAIDTSGFGTYVSGGETRKMVNSISSGLWYLEGQTVGIWSEGGDLGTAVITNGTLTLPFYCGLIQIGLLYNSDGQMLTLDSGAADGTAMGKTRRVQRVGFRLYRACGLTYGIDFSHLDDMIFANGADALNRGPALFTGVKSETIDADYNFENQICWRQGGMSPGTILAVMPQMETQDRG